MKTLNKFLFLHGKNYLSIAILTITLVGIVSSSIVSDYAVQANNIQATENSLVDLSFFGDYELFQNFTPETFIFNTSLPITQVFVSHKTYVTAGFFSINDNLTWIPKGSQSNMFILSIDFSLLQTFPFFETVRNPHYINNSGGVYVSPEFIKNYNLTIGQNFSLYDVLGSNPTSEQIPIQQALYNISLLNEIVLEDGIRFMQMFGLYESWESVASGRCGIMLMDSQYYEEQFRNEEGEEVITLLWSNAIINYIFDKTGVLEKKLSAIIDIFTTIINDISSSASALGYEFSIPEEGQLPYWYPFLANIEYYADSFNRFQMFLILGSFPIFLFGWWVNKTFMNSLLKSQLDTLHKIQSKGVSKIELRKKILLKSIITGVFSWIFAVLLSQILSLGLRYYLFDYEWTSFFSLNKVLNISTLILLPIGIGISFLSTFSALNTCFRKDTDILESESEQKEPRIIRKQSKKRVIIFGIISFLPLSIFLFPIFGITRINWWDYENYQLLLNVANLLSLLALVAPFFFIIAVIDLISLSAPKKDPKSKGTRKSSMRHRSYSRRIAFRNIVRYMKTYVQFTFIFALSITIIAQAITYNHIVEINEYHTNLLSNGNGLALTYSTSNKSYSHFQQVAQDLRNNEQIQSLIHDDITLFKTRDEYLDLYDLLLINTSEWGKNIEFPRNWFTLPSDEVYYQLTFNGSVLVSNRFIRDESDQVGDTFTFSYNNTDDQIVEKEVHIVGSFNQFPLYSFSSSQHPPGLIIADISFFQDVKIWTTEWIFYPKEANPNLYELYKLIQNQIHISDPTGWIGGDSIKFSQITFPKPSIPYSKFLQIEALSLAVIILFGLILLLKRQFESASNTRSQFRMKGMSKKNLRKIYFSEFLLILVISLTIFIPAFAISLQSIIALNLTMPFEIPYVISVPLIGILTELGAFFGALLVSKSFIIRRGIKKTDRKENRTITIS